MRGSLTPRPYCACNLCRRRLLTQAGRALVDPAIEGLRISGELHGQDVAAVAAFANRLPRRLSRLELDGVHDLGQCLAGLLAGPLPFKGARMLDLSGDAAFPPTALPCLEPLLQGVEHAKFEFEGLPSGLGATLARGCRQLGRLALKDVAWGPTEAATAVDAAAENLASLAGLRGTLQDLDVGGWPGRSPPKVLSPIAALTGLRRLTLRFSCSWPEFQYLRALTALTALSLPRGHNFDVSTPRKLQRAAACIAAVEELEYREFMYLDCAVWENFLASLPCLRCTRISYQGGLAGATGLAPLTALERLTIDRPFLDGEEYVHRLDVATLLAVVRALPRLCALACEVMAAPADKTSAAGMWAELLEVESVLSRCCAAEVDVRLQLALPYVEEEEDVEWMVPPAGLRLIGGFGGLEVEQSWDDVEEAEPQHGLAAALGLIFGRFPHTPSVGLSGVGPPQGPPSQWLRALATPARRVVGFLNCSWVDAPLVHLVATLLARAGCQGAQLEVDGCHEALEDAGEALLLDELWAAAAGAGQVCIKINGS